MTGMILERKTPLVTGVGEGLGKDTAAEAHCACNLPGRYTKGTLVRFGNDNPCRRTDNSKGTDHWIATSHRVNPNRDAQIVERPQFTMLASTGGTRIAASPVSYHWTK
jgi:hypothetical protein